MRRRILLFSCFLAGLSVIATSVLIQFVLYANVSENARREILLASELIGAGVELSGVDYLKTMPHNRGDLRVTFVTADGTVLFDSLIDPSQMENHADRPEIAAALRAGVGEATRFSASLTDRTRYYATRLSDGSVLRVAVTADNLFVPLLRLSSVTLGIVALVFAVASFIGTRVTRRIVAPINAIDLDRPEENAVYDELSPLLRRMKNQNDVIAEQLLALRKSRTEFSSVTDNMDEGIFLTDAEGCVLSCNRSALSLLRVEFKNPLRRNALTLNRSEAFSRMLEKALSGLTAEAGLEIDGRTLRLTANPVTDGDRVSGAVAIIMDVTERADREKLRREFTANVSHELKTPLTSLSGYAELIANGLARGDDAARFARKIYDETQRLVTLLGDIMLLSKLDEGAGDLEKETVRLAPLFEDVASRLCEAAKAKAVTVEIDAGDLEILAIRRVADEMMYNLIDNAIKYNLDGGSVRVRAEKRPDAVAVVVSDTGVGIAAADKERVFERFYRADKSHSKSIPGTGLGLSIVKHGAFLHGAEVRVESDGHSGTEVTLLFPTGDASERG